MTSRELLQQRATRDNGDTSWSISPLVVAALKGRLAVLDGIHRVDTSTLAVLKRQVEENRVGVAVMSHLNGKARSNRGHKLLYIYFFPKK